MATMHSIRSAKKPVEVSNPAAKVGAAQVFGRQALPSRPVAPEAMGPDKDAVLKQKKMGAAEVFGRRR
jgi:hypothetical protein